MPRAPALLPLAAALVLTSAPALAASKDGYRAETAAPPAASRTSRRATTARSASASGTRDGRSVVLGNPHFPWQGSERFYEMQLTVPGKLNAIGVGL